MIQGTCLVSVQAIKCLDCKTEEEAAVLLGTALKAAADQIAEAFSEALRVDGYKVNIQPEHIAFMPIRK